MANDYNRVIFTGRLCADPEFKTVGQSSVSSFTLAVNRQYKGDAGSLQASTEFIPIETWGRSAENVRDYLKKGRQVLLEGELHINNWEKDGVKHSRPVVKASSIQFLGSGKPEPEQEHADLSERGGKERTAGK